MKKRFVTLLSLLLCMAMLAGCAGTSNTPADATEAAAAPASGDGTTQGTNTHVENGTDLTAPNIAGGYSATYSVLVSTTYANAFELALDEDATALLEAEQSSIIYQP